MMRNKILQKFEDYFLRKGSSFVFCPVCGKIRKIKINSDNLREDGICQKCWSNSRKRHLARVLLKLIKRNHAMRNFRCLKKIPVNIKIDIYNLESNGALHEYLKHIRNYTCSEYFGPVDIIGKEHKGILNIDLQNMPFKDNSFDFVITTEVFEHIPDPYKAFAEIYRVLKKGGTHIFTVPFYENQEKDEVRAIINAKGELKHLLTPEYHGDPIRGEGILVYTIFAAEMFEKLKRLGFDVKTDRMRNPLFGVLGANNFVFITTKN